MSHTWYRKRKEGEIVTIVELPHQGSELPHFGLPSHDLSLAERGGLGGILNQTGQSGRRRLGHCSSREEIDLLHEGVGERANTSRRMVTYCSGYASSLYLSHIPLVRGMSRLDDGSAGYAEVEDEWLLKVWL